MRSGGERLLGGAIGAELTTTVPGTDPTGDRCPLCAEILHGAEETLVLLCTPGALGHAGRHLRPPPLAAVLVRAVRDVLCDGVPFGRGIRIAVLCARRERGSAGSHAGGDGGRTLLDGGAQELILVVGPCTTVPGLREVFVTVHVGRYRSVAVWKGQGKVMGCWRSRGSCSSSRICFSLRT